MINKDIFSTKLDFMRSVRCTKVGTFREKFVSGKRYFVTPWPDAPCEVYESG